MSKNNWIVGIGATVIVVAVIVLLVVRNTEGPAKSDAAADIARADLNAPPEPAPPDAAARGAEFWLSNYRGSSYSGAGYSATSYLKNDRNLNSGGGGFEFGFTESKPIKASGSGAAYYPSGSAAYSSPSSRGYEYDRAAAMARASSFSGSAVRNQSYGTSGYRPNFGGSSFGGTGFRRPTYSGTASSFAPRAGSGFKSSFNQDDRKLEELEQRAEVVDQRINALIEKIRSQKQ